MTGSSSSTCGNRLDGDTAASRPAPAPGHAAAVELNGPEGVKLTPARAKLLK